MTECHHVGKIRTVGIVAEEHRGEATYLDSAVVFTNRFVQFNANARGSPLFVLSNESNRSLDTLVAFDCYSFANVCLFERRHNVQLSLPVNVLTDRCTCNWWKREAMIEIEICQLRK